MLFKLFKALSARFIILFYIGVMLIIYKLYILLIPPLTAALIVLPILLILFILLILPLLFSLPSFYLIGKELIFPLFILYHLLYLPLGTLAIIPHLLVFFPSVPLFTLIIMVTAF